MRYFITYDNYINNSDLDKKVDAYSEDIKLIHKKKNGKYIIEPLIFFTKNKLELDSFIKEVEKKRDNISFMIELTSEEAKKVHPIFLKRFDNDKLINPDNSIKLFERDVVDYMDSKEFYNGRFINLESTKDDLYKLSIKSVNKKSEHMDIGEGEYFYSEIDRTLEKYSDKVVEIELVSRNKYKIKKHRLLIIDSVGQDRLVGLSKDVFQFLYKVFFNSKPVYIKDEEYKSIITTKRTPNYKKAYIIKDENIDTLIFNNNIKAIFKYINIYELVDGVYKKTSLESYINENIHKYTKKPSNN